MTSRDPGEELAAAHRALATGDVAGAAAQVERLRGSHPDWPPAVHLAGIIARAAGDLSQAEDLMRRSLDLPGVQGRMRAEYANNLGNLLRGAGVGGATTCTTRSTTWTSNCWRRSPTTGSPTASWTPRCRCSEACRLNTVPSLSTWSIAAALR